MGWREFWREARTPEAGSTPHRRAVLACGHLVIGQAAATLLLLPGLGWWAVPTVLVFCWLGKEVDDLARGGSLGDSIVDAGLNALGAATALAPPLVIAAAVAIALGITLHPRAQ